MSADATGYVFRCSPFSGATFIAHLAIADSVNDQHHNEFFMSIHNLAKKTRLSRRGTQSAVRALEARGFLTRLSEGKGEVYRYRFEFCPQPVVYETRGRREFAPPAQSDALRGRTQFAQTQREPKRRALGASHGTHFAPGSGVIKPFPKANNDEESA